MNRLDRTRERRRGNDGQISDFSKRIRDMDKILDAILCKRVSESVKQAHCPLNVNDVKPYEAWSANKWKNILLKMLH